jgi:hypothetical protein
VVGSIVQYDGYTQRWNSLALDGGVVEVAQNAPEEVLIAAAFAGLVSQVGHCTNDEHLGTEVLKTRNDLARGEARVKRDEDGTELEESVCENGVLGCVAQTHANTDTLADAILRQRVGNPVGELIKLCVSEGSLMGSVLGGGCDGRTGHNSGAVPPDSYDRRKVVWDRAVE